MDRSVGRELTMAEAKRPTAEAVVAAQVDRGRLREMIQAKYTEVAEHPEAGYHFHTGRPLAEMLGYDLAEVDALPSGTVESFAGTGNPFAMGRLRPGETVLDIGCGAGFDTLQAARQVGLGGRVIAVDMTPAMRAKTRHGAEALGLTNVEVRSGFAEDLPAPDASVDVVISNGVINLTHDKVQVMREVMRVLRPGGRFQIGDIVVHLPVPQDAKDDVDLWSNCIAGALLESEWQWILDQLGFVDVRWGRQTDVYSGSKHESDAKEFDTRGVTIGGVRPTQ
jgi:SAM-dependent methyltransferase